MKNKILHILLYLILVINLTACGTNTEDKEDTKEAQKELTTKEIYLEVLDNKRTYNNEDNISIKIDTYYDTLKQSTTSKYALLDMDNDEQEELVVSIGDMYYLILNYDEEDEIVYGFQSVIRGLEGLRENGYYISSGGATYNFLNQSTFYKNKRTEIEIASQEVDYTSASYKINGKSVTESEYQKFLKENFTNQKEPTWTDYDILSHIEISGEPASVGDGSYRTSSTEEFSATITIAGSNITIAEDDGINITKYGTFTIKGDKLLITYTSESINYKKIDISEEATYTIVDNHIIDNTSRTFTK